MSKVTVNVKSTLDEDILYKMLGDALEDTAQFVVSEVRQITPRDPQRMPKNPNVKVEGLLKQSIGYERKTSMHYVIGSGDSNGPVPYAKYLEFGTKKMPPRSFLRKTMIDKERQIIDVLNSTFDVLARKYKA